MLCLAAVRAAVAYPEEVAVYGIESGPSATNKSSIFEVMMPGVPGALAFGHLNEATGLYDTYTLTVSNNRENCKCVGTPQWVAQSSIGLAVGEKYRNQVLHTGVVPSCNVKMLGHGFSPTVLGLTIPPNGPTSRITIQEKREPDTIPGAVPLPTFTPTPTDLLGMQLVCPTDEGELRSNCSKYTGSANLCTTDPHARACCVQKVSDDGTVEYQETIGPPTSDAKSVPCLRAPDAVLECVPRPDLLQTLRCPNANTVDCSSPGDGPQTILYGPRTEDQKPLWAPPGRPNNLIVDYMFCVQVNLACVPTGSPTAFDDSGATCSIVSTAVPTSVYYQETSERTPYIKMSKTGYPGTCLRPSLFVEGQVHPPSMTLLSNSSANYCDNAYPKAPEPFAFDASKNSGGLTLCNNDPLSHKARMELCSSGGSEVLVGFVIAERTIDDACPPGTQTCLLIPGDSFSTVEKLVRAGADLTNTTIFFLPVPIPVIEMLVFEARALDLVYYSDPADPLNQFSNSSGKLLQEVNLSPDDSTVLFGPFCKRSGFSRTTLETLHTAIEKRKCTGPNLGVGGSVLNGCTTEGTYLFMQATSNATRSIELRADEVYVPSPQPSADITFTGTVFTSAFLKQQTTITFTTVLRGQQCGQFLFLAPGSVLNLRFDQRDCRGAGAQRVPVLYAGTSSGVGSTVLGNTVVDSEGVAAFIGGQIEQTRYIPSRILDTDRAVVGNTQYEYTANFSGNNRYLAAVFGSTIGAALVIDNVVSPTKVNATHAPQLECRNSSSGGVVCYRPGNFIMLAGEAVEELSICGVSCTNSIRASRMDGLGCFSNTPIQECQLKDLSTPGVRVVQTCRDGPFEPGDSGVVNRFGQKCGWNFGNVPGLAPCSERVSVTEYTKGEYDDCIKVPGTSILCATLYENTTLRPCTHNVGQAVCSAFGAPNSCNGVPVPVSGLVRANPCDVFGTNDLVLNPAAETLRQQWFITKNGVVFSSRNTITERTPGACLGGCSISRGCPPSQCDYASPVFACLVASADRIKVSYGCIDSAVFTVKAPRSDTRITHTGIARLAIGDQCLSRTDPAQPRHRLVLAPCSIEDPAQHWFLGQVLPHGAPMHLSDPLNSYVCPTVIDGRDDTVFLAPCGPCSVASTLARPLDLGARQPPFVPAPAQTPGVPSVSRAGGAVNIRVSSTRVVRLDLTDPSQCRSENGTVPCNPNDWATPSSGCSGFVGVGALACSQGTGSGNLRGVACQVADSKPSCLPGTRDVRGGTCRTPSDCRTTTGAGAVIDCTSTECTVSTPGFGYSYGDALIDDANQTVGYAITEAVIVQPYNSSFSITTFGPSIENASALTLIFGAAYEHKLFHRDIDVGIFIWLGTAALAVAAIVGVVLWCILITYTDPKLKTE